VRRRANRPPTVSDAVIAKRWHRAVGTLHIRNVPDEVVDTLKRRAQLHRRSLDAEVVQVLSEASPGPKRTIDEVVESVRRRAERMNLPPEVAPGAIDDIRQARDERAEHIGHLTQGNP
jgi:plasmid stability protein